MNRTGLRREVTGASPASQRYGLPAAVRVVEVGPRDGLQNEPDRLSLSDKVTYARMLDAAGLSAIEIGSFVRADVVPQMASTASVIEALGPTRATLLALVPNLKGLERALRSGVGRIALFTGASEAFTRANLRMSIGESLAGFGQVARHARSQGLAVRGYISTCWWCPFSGRVQPEAVVEVAQRLLELGCDELAISDTVGAATPGEVGELIERLGEVVPVAQLAVHLHDSRGTALANVLVALQHGVTTVDSSAGGLGGCPFAPGAAGNLSSEDLVYMLHGLGIATGIDLEALCRASLFMERALGRPLPSRYLRAGPFAPATQARP